MSAFVKGSEAWFLRDVLQEAPSVVDSDANDRADALEEAHFIKGSESWFHHFVWGAPEVEDNAGWYPSDVVAETVAGNASTERSPFIKGSESWFHDEDAAHAQAINRIAAKHHFVKGSESWFTNWFDVALFTESPPATGRVRFHPNVSYVNGIARDEAQMLDGAKGSLTKSSPRDRIGSASTSASDDNSPRDACSDCDDFGDEWDSAR